MRLTSKIISILILLITANSCSLTKRVHNPGWHISFFNKTDSNDGSIKKAQKSKEEQTDLNSTSGVLVINRDTSSNSKNTETKSKLLTNVINQETIQQAETQERSSNDLNWSKKKIVEENIPLNLTVKNSLGTDEPEEEKENRSTLRTILLILLFLFIFAAGANVSIVILGLLYYIFQYAFISVIPAIYIATIPVFFFIWGYMYFLLKTFFFKDKNVDISLRKKKMNRIALIVAACVYVLLTATVVLVVLFA